MKRVPCPLILLLAVIAYAIPFATSNPPPSSGQTVNNPVLTPQEQRGKAISGLTDTSVTVAAIIPTQGPLAETGAATRAMLTAFFEELNNRGGIHQRRIELRFVDMTSDPAETIEGLRRLIESDQVFAMVGGVIAGVDTESVRLAEAYQIPFVGPNSLLPEEGSNNYVFYLSSGVRDQARALVNFAANKAEIRKTKLQIVYPETEIALRSVSAIEAQAKKVGWENIGRHIYVAGVWNPRSLAQKLKAEGSAAVFFFGSGQDATALMKEGVTAAWTPSFFMSGLAFRDVSQIPSEFRDKVFLSFPSVPSDVSATGLSEFTTLRQKHKLPERSVASQIAALAAAKVFAAAVTNAGRELTRDKLITSLESLSNFETGLTPKLTFGKTRRLGARGAYIVSVDVDKKTFSTASAWIEAN